MSDDVAEGLGKTTQQASQVSDEFASGAGKDWGLDNETAITRKLLEQTQTSTDELANYLENIDAKLAKEFRETGQ